MAEQKFKPILFSTQMIQAIREGRKTMTRRVVKGLAKQWLEPDMFTPEYVAHPDNNMCPYGKVNDVLWVRETFMEDTINGEEWFYVYKADNENYPTGSSKWKPSIFMPKDACRIFLEITGVKVERLQDISGEDIRKEGICLGPNEDYNCLINNFQSLWQMINGKESWHANPFVWCVSFKKIDKPENFK